jgi:transposase
MEDWWGGISCFYRATGGFSMVEMHEEAAFKIFLGIDISKEKFDACCIGSNGERLFRVSASMNKGGFDELLMKVSSIAKPKDSILIGMESTACYHINLFSFLTSKGFTVIIINPLLISNFMKLQLRKTKTDKKDAVVIAQFLRMKKDSLSQNVLSPDDADMRDLARQRESLVDQMTAIKSDTKRVLTITFPELEHITGIFTKSMLRLLCHYPSAESIRKAKRAKIAKILIPGSYGKQTDESVDAIIKAAASSIGTASPAKEMIIKQKASILIQLEEHLQELTDMLIEQCQAQMKDNVDILTSIRGIGEKSATNFLVELGGDPGLFPSHRQVIAMAGLDPSVYESGQYVGLSKISKRGNRHLRRIIWLMTVKVIQYEGYFHRYFEKRIKDGLIYKKAVIATAHKLIRVIFAMLSQKTTFNAKANS